MVDKVFLRILNTEDDESFQAALHKFLTPVMLKLASDNPEVRKKVMEVLTHISKKLESRPQVTLPVQPLLSQYIDPNGAILVTVSTALVALTYSMYIIVLG